MRHLVVAACFFAVLTLACSKGPERAATSSPEPPPTPTLAAPIRTERQRPPAEVAPASASNSRDVIAAGDNVPFTVCNQRTGWQKPSPDQMTQVFTDRRFGDGVAPRPLEYTYYLRRFYFPTPFSASLNKHITAFGALWEGSGNLEQFCDLRELRTYLEGNGLWRELTSIGYRAVEIRVAGTDLAIVVDAASNGWQNAIFPYPFDDGALGALSIITNTQIVDTSGRLLYQELWPATGVAWQQSLQYDASGRLEFLVIGGITPYASAPITINTSQTLLLYSSSPPQTITGGRLRVLNEAGDEVMLAVWLSGVETWRSLATILLQPGTYRLLIEDALSEWHHFVLLAADAPLPPGVK